MFQAILSSIQNYLINPISLNMSIQPLFIWYYIYYDCYTAPLNNFTPRRCDPHNSIERILIARSGSPTPSF